MEKIINVGNRKVRFTANAATPMKYRNAFKGCDIFRDLISLTEADEDADLFTDIDMGMFERIAYIMSDGPMKGESLEEWLSQFELMDVIAALPDILSLWEENTDTQSISGKNA